MHVSKVMTLVGTEYDRAVIKHPIFSDSLKEGCSIISEEVGELWQAVNDFKEGKGDQESIRTEALQTAAAAVRFLVYLDKIIEREAKVDEVMDMAIEELGIHGRYHTANTLKYYFNRE